MEILNVRGDILGCLFLDELWALVGDSPLDAGERFFLIETTFFDTGRRIFF